MMRSILRVVTLSGFYFSSVLAVPVASPQNEFVTLNACAAVGAVFANENAVGTCFYWYILVPSLPIYRILSKIKKSFQSCLTGCFRNF